MIKTESFTIDGDQYTLTQLAVHPHGIRIYYRMHAKVLPMLGHLGDDMAGFMSFIGQLLASDEFREDIKTMMSAGLRCNNVEIKDYEAHIYDGKLHRMYELVFHAIRINYSDAFQGLIGKVRLLVDQLNAEGGSESQLTSILGALGLSQPKQPASKS